MNADLHLESASVALTPGGGGDAGGPLAEEACPASPPAAPSGSSGAGGFSYDEVFPALPEKEAVPEVSSSSGSLGQWNHRMHVKSSVITQVGGGARRGGCLTVKPLAAKGWLAYLGFTVLECVTFSGDCFQQENSLAYLGRLSG